MKMTRMTRILPQPAVLFTVVLLLLAAGGPAKAADVLGLTTPVPDGGDTSKIIKFNTALGTPTTLADTGLTTDSTDAAGNLNDEEGPNALAYDPTRGTAYYATTPSPLAIAAGVFPILYSQVIDPVAGPAISLGPLVGTSPHNATFYENNYYYIDAGTDDLRKVSFTAGGAPITDVKIADLLAGADSLTFGDCSADPSGLMFCSADSTAEAPGDTVIFSADLTLATPVYTPRVVVTDDILQLAHGGEGTLYGHNGVDNDLFYINLRGTAVPLGTRHLTLPDGISGFPDGFTDFSTFNPLCDCGPVKEAVVALIIDEQSIDNGIDYLESDGTTVATFTAGDVDDGSAAVGRREQLTFFGANPGTTIFLFTGAVGSEAWHALTTIPADWATAGPSGDGLHNFIGHPGLPDPWDVGVGLGGGGDESLLTAGPIPNVTPLRATGLKALEGRKICAIRLESSVGTNYDPLTASIDGEYQGTVAFEVIEVLNNTIDSGDLPQVEIEILDSREVCTVPPLELFTQVPVPVDSSDPDDFMLP